MNAIEIGDGNLSLAEVELVARRDRKIALSESAKDAINKSREAVERIVASGEAVYGINTGFGEFSKVSIAADRSELLQKNLIVSHACGVGNHLPAECARALVLLRINALARGFSGARLKTIDGFVRMLNGGVTPAVPEKGSLGASGDLAPLSHAVLPLIGLGEAYYRGELMSGARAMELAGIETVALSAKEGLALINGTQAMTGVGALATLDALRLAKAADIAAALSMEAMNGIVCAFSPEIHAARPHRGQIDAAANVLRLLEGSERTTRAGEARVQDAYSLRCAPQVHGASRDALRYVAEKVEIEMNAVTDNPIILADRGVAISGGNFHGQPMALCFDFLGIALAELASVSERRVERLVNPALSGGLPAFLTERGGLHSGFMIAQYTAAALVSENKVLAHPASVDSIPSSAGQEDHVSMGMIAARKAREIYFNARQVVAIELLAAAQGVDLSRRSPGRALGKGTRAAYQLIRGEVGALGEDREMYPDFRKIAALLDSGALVQAVEKAVGELA